MKLFLCAALAGLAGAALPAFAQTVAAPPPRDEPVRLAPFELTGTHLSRPDPTGALPVTILDRDAIAARDALTPVELLASLPQVTGVPQNESAIGGTNGRGDNANVSLRGLGAANTLVLLNGRRLAPHPTAISDPTLGALGFSPNVNQLPGQAVARVELLRDGAASIYGSDAIAGVINTVTRRDFAGTEGRTRLGVPEHGGGGSFAAALTHGQGFAGGRGRWLSVLESVYRRPVFMRQRDFSRSANHTADAPAPFNLPGSAFDGRSAVSSWPSFRIGAATTASFFRPVSGAPALTGAAPTRAANPEYYLDVNAYQNQGFSRSARVNGLQSLEYDLGPRVTLFGEFSFYHARTNVLRSPIPFNAPGSEPLSPIAADNPYNPYGSRFYEPTGAPNPDGTPRLAGAPQALVLVSQAIKDDGPENIVVHSGVWRGLVGARGRLCATWTWETGALYTRAATADQSDRAIRLSLFQDALLRRDLTAYNPFGYTFKVAGGAVVADQPYVNPPAVLGSFVRAWRRDGFSSLGSVDARAAGPLFSHRGGEVSLALGGELRRETFSDHRPEFAGLNPPGFAATGKDNDFLLASPKPDSSGSRTVAGAFAETHVPLTQPRQNLPLLHALGLGASLRFERTSDFGATTRPRTELGWTPWRGVRLRASLNRGFSAPNLPTLHAPTQFSLDVAPGVTDPYRNPVTNEGPYVQRMLFIGNPRLQPVTATGKSAGLALEAPRIPGLVLTVDIWQIDQANVMGTRTPAQILNRDAALLSAYTQSQLAAGRPLAQIDAGSGTPDYHGDPDIVRNPASPQDRATFAAYNAAHPNAPAAAVGTIVSRRATYQNLAQAWASGVDLGLAWNLPERPLGRIGLATDWTYSSRLYQISRPAGLAPLRIERLGVDGATRWRGTGTLTWRRGNWQASASAFYIGAFADSGAPTTAANYASLGAPRYLSKQFDSGGFLYRYVVRDVVTANAGVRYRFSATGPRLLARSALRLGVVNLTDRPPPLASGAAGYSAAVHGALFPGRTWTLEFVRPL